MRKRSSKGIVERVQRKDYDLDELLKKITHKNVHEEIQFGNQAQKPTAPSPGGLPATITRRGRKA
jgi:hypothetical protein